jgi:IS5 family transposase
VAHHQAVYGHPPHLLTADRGFPVAGQETILQAAGGRQIAVPAFGRGTSERRAQERRRDWKRRYRWRAGVEGRIHSVRRDDGLRRCRSHGEVGLLRDVGWGILASQLRHIAGCLAA